MLAIDYYGYHDLIYFLFDRYVLVSALREMNETKSITEAPKDCDNSGSIWETGKELFG